MHTNSGVGNKTAYLISQGTRRSRAAPSTARRSTGIDGADTGLTKTGKLYFDAITKLTSGSDYANLASVLEQSCADFVTSGTAGFTAADCAGGRQGRARHRAAHHPDQRTPAADAVSTCPTGTTMRELFNSETGTPASKLTSAEAGMWTYGVNPDWGSNATSGLDSWFGYNPAPNLGDPASASLTTTDGHRPAGRPEVLPGLPAVAALRVVPGSGLRSLHRRRDRGDRSRDRCCRHGDAPVDQRSGADPVGVQLGVPQPVGGPQGLRR